MAFFGIRVNNLHSSTLWIRAMSRSLSVALSILLASCLVPVGARAEEPLETPSPEALAKADASIAPLLKARNTPYTVDDDGDYRILVNVGEGRSQIVWVRSVVHETDKQRIREIWTYGYRSEENRIPANVANRLLSENFDLILGAWARSEGNAVLVLKIPANADADTLDEAIDLSASIGDRMEQKLVTGDDL